MSKSRRLFVSFSADDNASSKDGKGWVDEFVRYLGIFLQRINSETPEIIIQNQPDSKKADQLSENDGLIIVVSNNYLNKQVYKNDLQLIGDGNHTFRIDLHPIKKNELPKELRPLNEFRFFESGDDNNEIKTLSLKTQGQTFWLKIIDLAFEISRVLYNRGIKLDEDHRRTIFLAETSYDQVSNRDEIKRELQRHGHRVLPKYQLSGDRAELEQQVIECLAQADLTVQIIGEEYGELISNSDKSIVEVQNDIANKHFGSSDFIADEMLHRLIWMPFNLKPKSDTQKLYLDQMRDDIESSAGAEIIQTPLEILKTVIHARLQVFSQEKRYKKELKKERSSKKSVYLLFDKKDEGDVKEIVAELNAKNIDVIVPDFSGKQIELLNKHRRNLVLTDGVLLFANKNLNWVNSKLNDIIKAPGFGRDVPFEANGIINKDASIPKEKIANFGDLILLNGDGNKTDLTAFTDKITKK